MRILAQFLTAIHNLTDYPDGITVTDGGARYSNPDDPRVGAEIIDVLLDGKRLIYTANRYELRTPGVMELTNFEPGQTHECAVPEPNAGGVLVIGLCIALVAVSRYARL